MRLFVFRSSVDRYLQDAAVNQAFKAWEVNDNVARARLDRSLRPPEMRVLELIHKAAFRKGLGYSVYSPKWMLGNHSSEIVNYKNNFYIEFNCFMYSNSYRISSKKTFRKLV
jgi:hypothetical protein